MRVIFFVFYYTFLLWYGVNFLSLSVVELKSIEDFPILSFIISKSIEFFGKNDFALRIPSLIVSVISILIFYEISKKILKDYFLSVLIFALLPGFIIASLIINKSIYLIFITLLFFYLEMKNKFLSYFYLFFVTFLDKSLIVLYIGVIFYAIYNKNNFLLVLAIILLTINANYFNYKIKVEPNGYFLNLFWTYSLIFSPFIFVYFLYSLYKIPSKDVIFFVSATAFIISIFFSFKEKIKIDDYAPYVIVYTVYMVKVFLNSYKIRLPIFRIYYKVFGMSLFISLIFFDILLFKSYDSPFKHLTQSFYIPKKIINLLKEKHINNIQCNNNYLCKILYFYGLNSGTKFFLYKEKDKIIIFKDKRKILEIVY